MKYVLFISFLLATTIAFGRQLAVIGRVRTALWFFSHFEQKRLFFSISSLSLLLISMYNIGLSGLTISVGALTILLIMFAFFFDMKFFFPEINRVVRKKAKDTTIKNDTSVIGLHLINTAVAYPLKEAVIPRHIILDKIEDKQVLICFCALCQSALAFSTNVDGKELYFRVAGVWRRNMIIIDTLTNSLWQQATGECIYGPFKGKQLELLSGENVTWGEWKKKYNETEFAYEFVEARKGYWTREKMNKLLDKAVNKITMPGFSDLSALPNRETVFGVHYNGVSRAYRKKDLMGERYFEDQYLDKSVLFSYNEEADYLYANEKESEEKVIVEKHWWLGWKEFHPETEIWKS